MILGLDHDLKHIFASKNNFRAVSNIYGHPQLENKRTLSVRQGEEIVDVRLDLTLLQLSSPFEFGEKTNIYPICLINQKKNIFENDLYAANWGESQIINEAKKNKVIRKRMASDQIEGFNVMNNNTKLIITEFKQGSQSEYADFNISSDEFILTSRKRASYCDFERGTPLVTNINDKFFAVGILTDHFSMTLDSNHGYRCEAGKFSLSIPIYNYLSWIESYVGESMCMG